MGTEAQHAAEFYATSHGAVAARLVRDRLAALWPSLDRQVVVGIGFADPYLSLWRQQAERCIAIGPAQMGPALSGCSVDEESLPLPDLCADRVLLVHGLENADNARRMMREVWRILKDDGLLLLVAPNRLGMWAHVEATPFGQGRPYSPGQIGRLLADSLFRVERKDHALYVPPLPWAPVLRSAALFEQAGRRLVPRLAGVTITEAVKDMYAAIPLSRSKRRRLVLSEAA